MRATSASSMQCDTEGHAGSRPHLEPKWPRWHWILRRHLTHMPAQANADMPACACTRQQRHVRLQKTTLHQQGCSREAVCTAGLEPMQLPPSHPAVPALQCAFSNEFATPHSASASSTYPPTHRTPAFPRMAEMSRLRAANRKLHRHMPGCIMKQEPLPHLTFGHILPRHSASTGQRTGEAT